MNSQDTSLCQKFPCAKRQVRWVRTRELYKFYKFPSYAPQNGKPMPLILFYYRVLYQYFQKKWRNYLIILKWKSKIGVQIAALDYHLNITIAGEPDCEALEFGAETF